MERIECPIRVEIILFQFNSTSFRILSHAAFYVLTSSRGGTSSTLKASRSPELLWYVGLPHSSTWTLTGSMMDRAVSCSFPSRHENT